MTAWSIWLIYAEATYPRPTSVPDVKFRVLGHVQWLEALSRFQDPSYQACHDGFLG